VRAGFDYLLAHDCCPPEALDVVLHALAAACAAFGQEAELLARDASIAETYFRLVRGISATTAPSRECQRRAANARVPVHAF
jgi:hypothetical protein